MREDQTKDYRQGFADGCIKERNSISARHDALELAVSASKAKDYDPHQTVNLARIYHEYLIESEEGA